MAITRDEIIWLEPGFEIPERSAEVDAEVWSVWADMTGTEWWDKNGFPFAVLGILQGTAAYFLVQRLYEIHGTGSRYGLVREN